MPAGCSTDYRVRARLGSTALHRAMQFWPRRESDNRRAAGLDPSAGLLVTDQLQISLLDGAVDHQLADHATSLFPLADRQPPIRRAVKALQNSPMAQRIISALLLQILYQAVGRRSPAVLVGPPLSPLAYRILTGCGLKAENCAL